MVHFGSRDQRYIFAIRVVIEMINSMLILLNVTTEHRFTSKLTLPLKVKPFQSDRITNNTHEKKKLWTLKGKKRITGLKWYGIDEPQSIFFSSLFFLFHSWFCADYTCWQKKLEMNVAINLLTIKNVFTCSNHIFPWSGALLPLRFSLIFVHWHVFGNESCSMLVFLSILNLQCAR